jgi:hypothetical protein
MQYGTAQLERRGMVFIPELEVFFVCSAIVFKAFQRGPTKYVFLNFPRAALLTYPWLRRCTLIYRPDSIWRWCDAIRNLLKRASKDYIGHCRSIKSRSNDCRSNKCRSNDCQSIECRSNDIIPFSVPSYLDFIFTCNFDYYCFMLPRWRVEGAH